MSAAEDFDQIRMQFIDPLQYAYEVVRPIVLFGETAAERSRQTDIDRTLVGDKARRFVIDGMMGLTDGRTQPTAGEGPIYPEAIAGYIIYLKQLYLPIHLSEIERILERKFGYKTNHHTLKWFLQPYGWNKKSIADCLKLSRSHVYTILDAFEKEGFEGLEDHRGRPPQHPDNQLDLPFIKEVLDLQREYPRAGRFRIYGLLDKERDEPLPSERTVGRAMAINRQFHGASGPWTSARTEPLEHVSYNHLPYRPDYPHHMWFTDIRYLVQIDGSWVYSICVLEGYSRKMVAGMVAAHQDLTAVLQILYVACRNTAVHRPWSPTMAACLRPALTSRSCET